MFGLRTLRFLLVVSFCFFVTISTGVDSAGLVVWSGGASNQHANLLAQTEDPFLSDELKADWQSLPERHVWFNPLLLAVLVLVVWLFCRPNWSMMVVVDSKGVRSHRGLPKSREREIIRFLTEEVSLENKVTIGLIRLKNGYLRTHFKGRVDEATRQRIRNFLLTQL